MKITSALLAIFSLSACGGGGTENTTNAVAEDTTTETAPTRVGDLKVSSGFNFVGGETLTIKITHSGSPRQRLYLNICSDFTRVGGQYQVNYATCPLRTSIQDGYKEFEIALSSSEQQL
ncbi:MAG: hypothetical protein GY770_16340, partial [Aestuariibacter sp.]|nr:hypothetical protein [Aestuariibacter sp.]